MHLPRWILGKNNALGCIICACDILLSSYRPGVVAPLCPVTCPDKHLPRVLRQQLLLPVHVSGKRTVNELDKNRCLCWMGIFLLLSLSLLCKHLLRQKSEFWSVSKLTTSSQTHLNRSRQSYRKTEQNVPGCWDLQHLLPAKLSAS